MEDENLELYKSLKDEYRQYGFYVQTLCMTKFVAIAGIISFCLTNENIKGNQLTALGMLLIPIVCFFIDLKILEMTLFLKSVSDFLAKKYSSSFISEWEKDIWSKSFFSISRSILTIFSSVGMSFLILWATLILVGIFMRNEWWNYCLICGITFTILGLAFSIMFVKKIWKI